ncbi:uncharacterized protein HMPREF1541_05786 [Cyphellophora europaea CBS 101466]|uniref:BTB domain-containing protein n=1 Tax=Cyphellophora europaea (strain CBS 101466) TaxID=1220924 RepID=W2RTB5_CYPE1|nr:uncharacterized protein HMPREF1541_05786 [Cyphellophora europaea CBS 101466]ETN39560.1 hypothetical protein HMPREF1541_05786 [Cyphellophora europaea CBS 101466]
MADPDSLAEGFTEGFASQLSTSLFHDFVLKCEDGHELKVHRMILQPNEAAVKPIFREGVNQSLELPEDDPALIARMLTYMDTGDYSTKSLTISMTGDKLAQFHGVSDNFHCTNKGWPDRCLPHHYMMIVAG